MGPKNKKKQQQEKSFVITSDPHAAPAKTQLITSFLKPATTSAVQSALRYEVCKLDKNTKYTFYSLYVQTLTYISFIFILCFTVFTMHLLHSMASDGAFGPRNSDARLNKRIETHKCFKVEYTKKYLMHFQLV